MKKFKFKILAMFAVLLLLPAAVLAFTAENGNAIYVGEDRTINGNYYAAGTNVTIDGRVTGDVFCAGQSIVINGTVEGDVICAGQSVSVGGTVGGDLRVAASDINIRGTIERGATVAAANVSIEKDARVGWDVLIAAANVQIRGELGRSLLGGGANYVLGGKINGDVDLYMDSGSMKNKSYGLSVGDTAVIGGRLAYRSVTDADISEKAQISGEVTRKTIKQHGMKKSGIAGFFTVFALSVLSALAVGWVLIRLWKTPSVEMTENMFAKFWPALGFGSLVFILTPIVVIILAITLIGIRLAFLLIWTWLIVLMLSKVVAGIAVGRLLLRNFWTAKKDSLNLAMFIGIIISWLVFYIPIFGGLLSIAAILWGMGGLVMYLKAQYGK